MPVDFPNRKIEDTTLWPNLHVREVADSLPYVFPDRSEARCLYKSQGGTTYRQGGRIRLR